MNAPEKVVSLQDAADNLLRDEAMSNLKWRLVEGKEVGGMTFDGLLDIELDGERRRIVLDDLTNVLCGDKNKDEVRDGIVERFLLSPKGRQAIEEEMERLDKYEPDPAEWQPE